MKNEVKNVKLTLQQAKPFVLSLGLLMKCQNVWCGKDLLGEPIYAYPDPEGDKIDGLEGNWFLFVHCPECGNDYSLARLRRITYAKKRAKRT